MAERETIFHLPHSLPGFHVAVGQLHRSRKVDFGGIHDLKVGSETISIVYSSHTRYPKTDWGNDKSEHQNWTETLRGKKKEWIKIWGVLADKTHLNVSYHPLNAEEQHLISQVKQELANRYQIPVDRITIVRKHK